MVLRSGKWTSIQTDDLLPGDIVSILRSGQDSPVACDIAVLSGSCIANEAMLSGESTPQLKESLFETYVSEKELEHVFDMEADKNSVLFGIFFLFHE